MAIHFHLEILFLGMYQKFKKVTMYKGICLRMFFPALCILMHIENPNIKKTNKKVGLVK